MPSAAERVVRQVISFLAATEPTSETDGQLLSRWAAGKDNRAFAALVGRHASLVWRASQNVLNQREDVEDVFQATFLVLAQKAASLRNRSSLAGWLFETAQRLALKARTSALRRRRHEERALPRENGDPLEEI